MPGHVPRGAPCLLTNDRLDPVSHQFESDCGPQDFCGPVGSTSAASTPPRATASASVGSTSAAAASSSLRAAASARPALSSATEADSADADDAEDDGEKDDFGDDDFGDDDGAADGSELRRRAVATAPSGATPPSTICQERQCRRELYPFGYRYNETLPPLCPVGRFCPDEGNECQPLVPLGGSCQFGRDEQCEPPAGSVAICLASACTRADAWLGDPCRLENTAYTGYLQDGSPYSDIVTRSNCSADAFYCAPTTLQCTPLIDIGQPCSADVSCVSGSCASSGLCAPPPQLHVEVPPAVFVVVAGIIAVGLATLLWSLQRMHTRTSAAAREVRETFWDEQRAYSEAIRKKYASALLTPCPIAKDSAPAAGMHHRRSPRVAFEDH